MNATIPHSDAVAVPRVQAGRSGAASRRWISGSAGRIAKLLPVDEVLFLEAGSGHTRVVCAADEIRAAEPLHELVAAQDPSRFWRVHPGVVVRADAVLRARRDELGRITLRLHQRPEILPVSQDDRWRFEPV